MCQAHPVLVKKANQMCGLCLFKFFIPGPVSCRCPGGLLETPPRWHATIYIYETAYILREEFMCFVDFAKDKSGFCIFDVFGGFE